MKICTRWISKLFIPLKRVNRVDCCEELLESCNQNLAEFFGHILMGDKTWIHHYDPLHQQETKTWKKPGEKIPTRQRITGSATKIITTVFWDCEGVLLVGDWTIRRLDG